MVPMLGSAFATFWIGITLGAILYLLPSTRRSYTFAFIAISGSIGAVVSCICASLSLEHFVNPILGGYGFFGGYALGGILGAFGGLKIALFATRRSKKIQNTA